MANMRFFKAKAEKIIQQNTPYDNLSQVEADMNKCISIVDHHFLLFSEPTIEEAWLEAMTQITEQYGASPQTQLRCEMLTDLFAQMYTPTT